MTPQEIETYIAQQFYTQEAAAQSRRDIAWAVAQTQKEVEYLKAGINGLDISDEALGCGIEDRNITNRYEAARYGFDVAVGRALEFLPE